MPRSVGPLNQLSAALPRRGREAIARAVKADKVLSNADPNARKAYELRASHSTTAELEDAAQPELEETTK